MSHYSNFFLYDIEALTNLGLSYKRKYKKAKPFVHCVIDNFLPADLAEHYLSLFPNVSSEIWQPLSSTNAVNQPNKLQLGNAYRLKKALPEIGGCLNHFNSFAFLNFLTTLTGIKYLLPDPYLNGGGFHQILKNGKLNLHTDFNHLENLGLYRRLNVLLYLNKNWETSYCGQLMLQSALDKNDRVEIEPVFNRLVIFETTKRTIHGHPIPLSCPQTITRKSIALYYYTTKPNPRDIYNNNTEWIAGLMDRKNTAMQSIRKLFR